MDALYFVMWISQLIELCAMLVIVKVLNASLHHDPRTPQNETKRKQTPVKICIELKKSSPSPPRKENVRVVKNDSIRLHETGKTHISSGSSSASRQTSTI